MSSAGKDLDRIIARRSAAAKERGRAMSAEGQESDLRQIAREEPEAVRAVADRAGGRLGDWLHRILEEVDTKE